MKRRSLTLVLCLLATLSLASVGFAAWVISAGDVENATGQILVENVSDERLEIRNLKFDEWTYNALTAAENMPKFAFGKPDSSAPGYVAPTYDWLQNTTVDKLTIKVTFNVYWKGSNTEITDKNEIDLSVTFATVAPNVFDAGDGKVYAKIVAANPTIVYNDTEDYFECDLELQWGDYFGVLGTNPFMHYNSQPITEELATDAKTKLGKMFTALGSAQYSVSISAQTKNS